ncbi:cytochrome P450 [Streptosporangium becharense]|uniref:Cytochrome P450 n=1 Tax=Streptosporangium becharense TaxID=1816182 RepID=A0A7W9MEM4_9ACTN|nr:cytochrome P450 [Streptosporangium becharense]MBB2910789.1 cytochrome P450 [Streptosporangium becharense]MBB5817484.1 cytochrome P450 [Streptosporangium becharense]
MPDAWTASIPEPLSSMSVEPLLGRDYDSDPTLVHERLRRKYGPVAPVDLLGMPVWLVIGYGEVLQILQDKSEIWSKNLDNWRARAEGRVPPDWPVLPAFEVNNSVFRDGQALRRLRDAWTAALAPFQDPARPQAQMLENAVRKYADDLIDVLAEGTSGTGWADLSAQYGRPLPLMVTNRLLGFESARGDDVLMDVWRLLDAGPDAAAASGRLFAAVTELAAAKASRPGDDIPSYMLAALPDLTLEELARELLMLPGLVADFTGTLICNTLAEVMTNPDIRASLSQGIIEETVNRVALLNPPMANLTFRFPTVDVKVGRFVIAAGDPVMVSVAAAHGDPLFGGTADPGAIRSTRAHLAWGAGPHRCLGQRLATRITTIAVSRLFERLAHLRLALPADQLPWRPSPFMRSLRSLPVRFELAQARVRTGGPGAVDEPGTPVSQAAAEEPPRSALWRFLRALRGER